MDANLHLALPGRRDFDLLDPKDFGPTDLVKSYNSRHTSVLLYVISPADGGPDLQLGRGLDDDAVGHESGGRLNSRLISANTSSAGRPRPARMSSRPRRMPSSTRASSASSRCRSDCTASAIASSEEEYRPLRTLACTNCSRSLGKWEFIRRILLGCSAYHRRRALSRRPGQLFAAMRYTLRGHE